MYMNREEWVKKSEYQISMKGICRFWDLCFLLFYFFFFCISFFLFFNLNIYIYLKFLQCCVDFCHIATQISHDYTYIPSLPILPLLPPPIPPGHHRGTRLGSLCYTAIWFFERQTCEIHIWTNDLFGSGTVKGCSCKWRNINFGWKC